MNAPKIHLACKAEVVTLLHRAGRIADYRYVWLLIVPAWQTCCSLTTAFRARCTPLHPSKQIPGRQQATAQHTTTTVAHINGAPPPTWHAARAHSKQHTTTKHGNKQTHNNIIRQEHTILTCNNIPARQCTRPAKHDKHLTGSSQQQRNNNKTQQINKTSPAAKHTNRPQHQLRNTHIGTPKWHATVSRSSSARQQRTHHEPPREERDSEAIV